jgi:hypothetical protein
VTENVDVDSGRQKHAGPRVFPGAAGGHPMHPALEELESINDFSKKYHHETNPGKADNEPINNGELQGYAKRTLAIAGGY